MAGISPKLPLGMSGHQPNYTVTKTIVEAVQQNLKNLVLPSPGERVMDPDFGVGVRNYLFENASEATYGAIKSRINQQVSTYLPFIDIEDIDIGVPTDSHETTSNLLTLVIEYRIMSTDDINILAISIPETI